MVSEQDNEMDQMLYEEEGSPQMINLISTQEQIMK